MKKAFVIVMSLIFLAIAAKDLTIYASFKINQDYIAEFLCINKDKKEFQCNGKCQLSKSLQKSKEQDQEKPLPLEKEMKIQLYQQDVDKLSLHTISLREHFVIYFRQNLHPSTYIHELLRPPC